MAQIESETSNLSHTLVAALENQVPPSSTMRQPSACAGLISEINSLSERGLAVFAIDDELRQATLDAVHRLTILIQTPEEAVRSLAFSVCQPVPERTWMLRLTQRILQAFIQCLCENSDRPRPISLLGCLRLQHCRRSRKNRYGTAGAHRSVEEPAPKKNFGIDVCGSTANAGALRHGLCERDRLVLLQPNAPDETYVQADDGRVGCSFVR